MFFLILELRGDVIVIVLVVIVVFLFVFIIVNYVEELWFFFRVYFYGFNRKYVIFIFILFLVFLFFLEILLFYILVCFFYSCLLINKCEFSVVVKNVDIIYVIYFRD